MSIAVNFTYIFSAMLFIFGLKKLTRPESARTGNMLSSLGMLTAVVVTLLAKGILDYRWIGAGMAVGIVAGTLGARLVSMTAMPQMVALLNGFGGVASLLVGSSVYLSMPDVGAFAAATIFLSVLIGGVTFSGSLVAWAKLNGVITGRPVHYPGQQAVNAVILLATLLCGALFWLEPVSGRYFLIAVIALSLISGIALVIPIGGADMPVVIALLNSFSGLAACAAGFAIMNNLLIVAGALVGASGVILTNLMCKAMNRSLSGVIFSGLAAPSAATANIKGEVKPINVEDAYLLLEAARSVVFVPGYGLAVAQAQHAVRELGDMLERNGCEVRYAIHPVAGRMPGHMNVLLAEADVPYDKLVEMDAVNPTMDTVDVSVVIGANDVVNTSAREDEESPIYGMPIINVDKSKTVLVLKRSMAAGFSGIPNPLFYRDNTRMLFGNGKATAQELVAEFKR